MKLKWLWYSFSSILFFSGCTHYFYAPALPLSPGFQEQGDIMVMAGRGVQAHSSGGELKAGYAFSNHFFGAAEAGFFEASEYLGNDGKGRYFGAAAGWYHLLEVDQRKGWLFSTHVALQQSRVQNIFSEENYLSGNSPVYIGRTDYHFRKYYVEPGVAILSRFVQLHGSVRIGVLRYHDLQTELNLPFGVSLDGLPVLHHAYPVLEPALTLSIGHRNGQFQVKWVRVGRKFPFNYADGNLGFAWVLYPNRFFKN